ncbi:MAG: hypothetical protein WAQ52_04290 [Terriglobales bacterium]
MFYPDQPSPAATAALPATPKPVALPEAREVRSSQPTETGLLRDLRRSRIRQRIWIALASAQAAYLIFIMFLH